MRGEELYHLMGVSCFAEQCVVSERSLIRVDPEVAPEIAAITGCAVVTGVGAAFNHMKDSTGEAVVVIGAGGVGLSAIMGLNLIGAHPVIAVDTVDARLERARTVGATHVINPATVTDVGAEVARINGRAAKWVLDAVGAAGTLTEPGGRDGRCRRHGCRGRVGQGRRDLRRGDQSACAAGETDHRELVWFVQYADRDPRDLTAA
jgi:Zn-dependent alcohol dehydrogenase